MKKVKKILVPTDFSKSALNAFRYAIWFADQYEAEIQLLHVIYPTSEPIDFPSLAAQIMEKQMIAAKESMITFMESGMVQVQATDELTYVLKIMSNVIMGTPQDQIKYIVKERDIDLIIMGTQGEHSNLEKFFGSVSTDTLEKAPCPVLVVPENSIHRKIKTIAYATDFTEADPFHIWQIGKLLTPFNATMRIVHVEKKLNEDRAVNMQELQDFFRDHPSGLHITFHTITAKSREKELKEFEDTWTVDLLIMVKPHRSFFERIFHKSMTKRMALGTKVPLLVLKT